VCCSSYLSSSGKRSRRARARSAFPMSRWVRRRLCRAPTRSSLSSTRHSSNTFTALQRGEREDMCPGAMCTEVEVEVVGWSGLATERSGIDCVICVWVCPTQRDRKRHRGQDACSPYARSVYVNIDATALTSRSYQPCYATAPLGRTCVVAALFQRRGPTARACATQTRLPLAGWAD